MYTFICLSTWWTHCASRDKKKEERKRRRKSEQNVFCKNLWYVWDVEWVGKFTFPFCCRHSHSWFGVIPFHSIFFLLSLHSFAQYEQMFWVWASLPCAVPCDNCQLFFSDNSHHVCWSFIHLSICFLYTWVFLFGAPTEKSNFLCFISFLSHRIHEIQFVLRIVCWILWFGMIFGRRIFFTSPPLFSIRFFGSSFFLANWFFESFEIFCIFKELFFRWKRRIRQFREKERKREKTEGTQVKRLPKNVLINTLAMTKLSWKMVQPLIFGQFPFAFFSLGVFLFFSCMHFLPVVIKNLPIISYISTDWMPSFCRALCTRSGEKKFAFSVTARPLQCR